MGEYAGAIERRLARHKARIGGIVLHGQAMIGQDDVSARDGNVFDQNIVHTPRNNEREGQGIILGPGDFVERSGIQGIVYLGDTVSRTAQRW